MREGERERKKHNFSTSLLFRKFVTRNKKFSNNSYAYMPRGMEQGYNIVKCNMRSLRVKRYQSHFLFDILPLYFNERNHFCCEFYHPRASYIAIFFPHNLFHSSICASHVKNNVFVFLSDSGFGKRNNVISTPQLE